MLYLQTEQSAQQTCMRADLSVDRRYDRSMSSKCQKIAGGIF